MVRAKVPLLILLFLIVHTSVLDRVHIAGVQPDVMLLLAVAGGIVGGSKLGALLGFASGLTVDLFLQTPLGLSALVFCLVGYGVGNVQAGVLRASWWIPVLTTVAASVAGELAYALVATVVGQPHLVNLHLLQVAGIVGLTNGVLAPIALRLVGWSVSGAREHAFA
jgi:rod shape-determining protein MreD